MNKPCTVEGCDRDRQYAKGLCAKHYAADRRKNNARVCSLDGCDRAYVSAGYCAAHYRRLRVYGDIQAGKPVSRREAGRTCEYKDCDRPHRAGGLCEAHYVRRKYGKDMDAPIQERRKHKDLVECLRPGCEDAPTKNGHCKDHYRRWHQMTYVYGIDWDQFDRMIETQANACAICRTVFTSSTINIDHCHRGGDVRGLLCATCNVGLGSFRDQPDLLRAAATYLEN